MITKADAPLRSTQARPTNATICPIDKMTVMIDLVDPDGVTAEWLTEVFTAEGVLRSGSVVSCAAEPLEAMSFTGVFRRLELRYDVDEPGLPRTLIAKFSTPDPEARAAMHSMGFYAREAAFYRELAASTPVPVPVCYYAAVDENDGRCVILLEDLTTARRGRSTEPCSLAEAERAIDAIALLHARWWQNPDVELWPWLDPEAIMPLDGIQPEFEAQWPVFLEKLSIPITDQVRQFGEWAAQGGRVDHIAGHTGKTSACSGEGAPHENPRKAARD
jgi:Ecdysteroid kinase-like family